MSVDTGDPTLRRSGIGGSDAAAIFGLSRFRSPYDVYQEKIGQSAPLMETEAMRWGKLLEQPVLHEYAVVTGNRIERVNRTLRHPEHPWMMAHLDARTRRPRRVVEAKTTHAWADDDWGEPGSDQVPADYAIQVHHYLAVTGYPAADIAVLRGGQRFGIYTIERNEQIVTDLIEGERAFWYGNVLAHEPPPIDGSEAASRYLRERFPFADDTEREATTDEDFLVGQYLGLTARVKAAEAELATLTNRLKESMGATGAIFGSGYRVTWHDVKGQVSWKDAALAAGVTAAAAGGFRGADYRRFVVTAK
jgi:putative phage-type endonuclease